MIENDIPIGGVVPFVVIDGVSTSIPDNYYLLDGSTILNSRSPFNNFVTPDMVQTSEPKTITGTLTNSEVGDDVSAKSHTFKPHQYMPTVTNTSYSQNSGTYSPNTSRMMIVPHNPQPSPHTTMSRSRNNWYSNIRANNVNVSNSVNVAGYVHGISSSYVSGMESWTSPRGGYNELMPYSNGSGYYVHDATHKHTVSSSHSHTVSLSSNTSLNSTVTSKIYGANASSYTIKADECLAMEPVLWYMRIY